jgi:hypothetical protein
MATPRVKAKRQKRFAIALMIGPLLVAGLIRCFGSRPITLHWKGTLLHPTSIGFEFHNFGLLLVVLSIVGLLWVVFLLIRWLWASVTSDDDRA